MRVRSLSSALAMPLVVFALSSRLGAARAGIVFQPRIRGPAIRGPSSRAAGECGRSRLRSPVTDFRIVLFSRTLDLSQRDQERGDRRSIQFDRFQGQIVLKITGTISRLILLSGANQERARRTYLRRDAAAFARRRSLHLRVLKFRTRSRWRYSHHVLRKVLGVDTEYAENVVLILPKASAPR